MRAKFLILIVLFFISCHQTKDESQKSDHKISRKSVTVIAVRKITYPEKGEAFGTVLPSQKVKIFPRIVGKIIERRVDVGDHVKRNQVLFRMIQDIPGMKFEPEEIITPIDGDVSRIMVEEGSRVTPQTLLLEIVNRERLYFKMYVIPEEFEIVRSVGHFEVTLDVDPGKTYLARLDKVYPEADPKTGMMAVRLQIKASHLIPAGTRGTVSYVRKKFSGFLIPEDAISVEGIHTYVWTVKDGRAHRKRVIPVAYEGKNAICQGNLAEEEMIVFAGWNRLNENDLVKIIKRFGEAG
jgi:multidrug efflux pump subunit AcrA (membrane-fusion protein)